MNTVIIDGKEFGFHQPEPTLYRVESPLEAPSASHDWDYRKDPMTRRYEWQARLSTRLEKVLGG